MSELHSLIEIKTLEVLSSNFNYEFEASQLVVQPTKREFEGDVTIVVFPFVKILKQSPKVIAETIGDYLASSVSDIEEYNVAGGFLNLVIKQSYWINEFNTALSNENFGFQTKSTGKTYMVEYSSPNTNKPLHLGHLRNNFLGYSVAEILKANGHEVYKTQIINDRGIHICKSMLAWQKFGNGETPESSGLKGDKLVGKYYVAFDKAYKVEVQELISQGKTEDEAKKKAPILIEAQAMLKKWEQKDTEVYSLWEKMNGWVYKGFESTYTQMGVNFDKLYYESITYLTGKDIVEDGLSKKVFFKKNDGSVWIDLSDEGLDEKLLLRADGTSVYMTQDIGTAVLRYNDYPSLSGLIYTVGNEQDYHFSVLFKILKKLGYSWADECYHLSYGMVDLPSGKMKSREGTVVDADDLMNSIVDEAKAMTQERGQIQDMSEKEKSELYNTIGLGGLKYYLLKVDPKKRMLFNPEESVDLNGNTAPFIQYGYARIQSILRKTEINMSVDSEVEISKTESDLLKLTLNFPNIIKEAGDNHSPAVICNYCYDLVKQYNSFYHSFPILGEKEDNLKSFRIHLSHLIAETIQKGMRLLGASVPQKM